MLSHRRRVALTLTLGLGLASGSASALASSFDAPASSDPYQQYAPASVQRNDTPNDPGYDSAEPDTNNGRTQTQLYDERFDLFGFPSALSSSSATYHDPFDTGELHADGTFGGTRFGQPQVSGFNAAGAWKIERGRPDVVVAILDTGIRWDELGLRRALHLNTGELPYPQVAGPALESGVNCRSYHASSYDANGDGTVNVEDYACDPRVSLSYLDRVSGSVAHLVTGQDLIHAFGDCRIDAATHLAVPGTCGAGTHYDNDGNGFANDIAGWNFFDNTNDPTDRSSYFAASGHGSGRANDAVEAANDGQGELGVCPHCQFMPVRVWDTFVSDGNTFGLGIAYATDSGAKVIEGSDGNLYHSAFTEAASQYAYDHGAVQTYSGDDLNTPNHNYPANYSHAIEVQGTVPDTIGLGKALPGPPAGTPPQLADLLNGIRDEFAKVNPTGTQASPATYFRGANTTQYGGHSSISMEGTTGSQNTGKASGAAGEVISAALDHGITLGPDETREILEATAERVTTPNTMGAGSPDLAAPPTCPAGTAPSAACATPDLQWTEHFGWGRVDLGAAVALAAGGKIPPQAAVDGPDWFAPLAGAKVAITGTAAARFATGGAYHWKLMWAPGLQPSPDSWQLAASGSGSAPIHDLGTIDLAKVRAALAATSPPADPGGPVFAPGGVNPLADQFTVQLEVTGTGIPTVGIDRRVLTAVDDPTLRPGYPKRLGTGGEAPIRYADLNGDNVPELVTPTEDGQVHAYEPDGSELPGWPVHTHAQANASGHDGAAALKALGDPAEPPRAPVIADLSGTGRPDVITAAGIHVYAWRADGTPLPGFPVSMDLSHCTPALEGPAPEGSGVNRHPKCGFLASPAIAWLQGHAQPPDIVVPGLDGWLYAFRPDGTAVPHFPLALHDPAGSPKEIAESINNVAVGDLLGTGHDDVVVATNEEYGAPATSGDVNFYGALAGAAGGSTRVYAVDGATGKFLKGWPIAVPGIIQSTLPLVGPGNDPSIAAIGGGAQIITSATGGGLSETAPDGTQTRAIQQNAFGPASNATDRSGELNLFEGASVGDLLGNGTPDVVKYGLSLGGVANLAASGQNVPYNHLIGAFDGSSGASLPAYPTITDDYQFLSASNVAKMAAGQSSQVLAGTGLGLLHAYDGSSGQDVTGFPKHTGGWLFSPAALSTDGRTAAITREGYLFEWTTGQTPCQPTGVEWPTFRHDPHDSGNFNTDATPPAAPAAVTLTRAGGDLRLRFTTPGDDGFCGAAAARYLVSADGAALDAGQAGLGKPAAPGATTTVSLNLSAKARSFTFQAVDTAGNVGAPVTLAVPTGPGQRVSGGGLPVGLPTRRPVVRNPRPPVAPAVFGRTAYLTRRSGVELFAACLAARACTADVTVTLRSRPRTALARRRGLRITAGNGGVVTIPLLRRTAAVRAALRRRHPAVVVRIVAGKTRRTITMTLLTTAAAGRLDAGRPAGGPGLATLGHTLFVTAAGQTTVLVRCLARTACAGSLAVRLGRTIAGRSRTVRLGAGRAALVVLRLRGREAGTLRRRATLRAEVRILRERRRLTRFGVELVRVS